MTKKVLVWVSGWVDSAVAAYLLQQEGYEVYGGFMVNYKAPEWEHCTTKDDLEEAKKVSKHLNLKDFFVFDFVEEYEQRVLNYMYEGYKKWVTPNPDIMCNKEVKFKVFLEEAMAAGFDYIATGHYARVDHSWDYHKLIKWVDNNKDQTYFLAWLSQEQLSKSLFPIGHLEKPEVRRIAEGINLPNAKRKDSQGICFVWKVKMQEFLEKKIPNEEGDIVDTEGKVVWKHKWVYYYTIGQRRWIWVWGFKDPIFVVWKDIQNNKLIVWNESDLELYSDKLTMSGLNIFKNGLAFPVKANAKIRYRQEDQECEVILIWEDRAEVKFTKSQRAISSGQICAVYEGEELILSGVIE